MSNFRVVSRGIKKIVAIHYHDSWPMPYGYGAMKAYVSTANLFCKIFVTNISGRLGSFSRLMASLQRRGQINHLQIQSVLYFSLREKTGSSLTLPSINKCAEHNKITEYFMWWPVCPVDSIYPRRSLLHTLGEDKKKTDTVLFSRTVLPIWALVRNAMHITILC